MKNPINTARDFLTLIIEPDVEDAEANQHDIRLVIHALISLHQINEWHFNDMPVQYSSKSEYINALKAHNEALYAECPVLDRLRELATNAKHCAPFSAGQELFGISAMDVGSPLTLIAISKDEAGSSEELLPIIRGALIFWRARVGLSIAKIV